MSDLGEEQELNVTTASICEAFVCSLHTRSKKASTVDELRYFMFCQKKQKNEMLPSMSDCLIQHLKRSNYQAFVWRHALEAMQDLESPEGHGWVRDEKHLLPLQMKKAPAPESLLDLKTCKCKMSSCLRNSSCNNTGLSCLKDATAWQMMKNVKTRMVLPAYVTLKKVTRSEHLNCLMFDIYVL